jgi:hypothetical protein
MSEMKQRLRKLRIIQSLLIGVLLIPALLAEFVSARTGGRRAWLLWVMAGLALVCILEGRYLRYRLISQAGELLVKYPDNPQALRRWEAGQLIGLAMAATVGLYGLVERLFGASLWQALLFYSVGLFLLLLWTPRPPILVKASKY